MIRPILLFAYGTLCDPEIRSELFGEDVLTHPGGLHGFGISPLRVYGSYPTIAPSEVPGAVVNGTVLRLTETQLGIADAYEGEAYHRIAVTLISGERCQAYISRTVPLTFEQ